MSEPDYRQIHASFPPLDENGEPNIGGESFHAVRLGDGPEPGTGLYCLENIPFFAALRAEDIVVCDESNPSRAPEILSVHEQSPRRTVSMVFDDALSDHDYTAFNNDLRALGVQLERATGPCFVASLPPDTASADAALLFMEQGMIDHKLVEYEPDDL